MPYRTAKPIAYAQRKPSRSVSWSVRRRDRSLPHHRRKFYHFVSGLICFSLYATLLNRTQALVILGSIGGLLVLFDLARLRFPQVNRFGLRLFGAFMRREELRSLTGNSFYILGLFLVVVAFPKTTALLSVLFLAIGDPVAAVVGTQYGKTKLWNGKSLEGALANFLASGFAAGLMGIFYFGLAPLQAFFLGVIGGAISMIAELLPFKVDDNFTIPVASALLLSAVFYFLPLI